MMLLREATEYGASESELLAVLDDRSINSLYAKFLSRCLRKPGVELRAKLLFQIIVAAARPLTLSELDVAIGLQVSDRSLEDLRPNLHKSPENYFRQLCGHFIAGHRWSAGVAIEYTAVYYLAIGNILEQHSARLKEADSEMAKNETPKARTTEQGTMGKMKEDVGKNQTQDKDITPLPWAAREGHLTLIKILLDHLTPKICIINRP